MAIIHQTQRGFLARKQILWILVTILPFIIVVYLDYSWLVKHSLWIYMLGIFLLLLVSAYASLALLIAMESLHPIKRLIAVGVMVILVGQSLLNVAVATGSMPTTGLPFPMLSYGGSSVMSSLMLAGLLMRVSRENEMQSKLDKFSV